MLAESRCMCSSKSAGCSGRVAVAGLIMRPREVALSKTLLECASPFQKLSTVSGSGWLQQWLDVLLQGLLSASITD